MRFRRRKVWRVVLRCEVDVTRLDRLADIERRFTLIIGAIDDGHSVTDAKRIAQDSLDMLREWKAAAPGSASAAADEPGETP